MAQLVRAPPCHGGGREFESLLGRLRWGLSSAGRASALQAEGHRFEPCRPHLLNKDGFPSGQRGQTVNLLRHASVVRIHLHPFKISIDILILIVYNRNVNIDAGWSSLEARRAHNPKVVGSNPAPAIFLCLFSFCFKLMKRFIKEMPR